MTATPNSPQSERKPKSKWNERFVKMDLADLALSPLAFALVVWLRRARDNKSGKAFVDVERLALELGRSRAGKRAGQPLSRRTLLRVLKSEKVAAIVSDLGVKFIDGREHWEVTVKPASKKPFVRVSWAWVWPESAADAEHKWGTHPNLSLDAVWAAACADRMQRKNKSFQVSVQWMAHHYGVKTSEMQVRMRAAEAAGLVTVVPGTRKGGKRAAVRKVHTVPVSTPTVAERQGPPAKSEQPAPAEPVEPVVQPTPVVEAKPEPVVDPFAACSPDFPQQAQPTAINRRIAARVEPTVAEQRSPTADEQRAAWQVEHQRGQAQAAKREAASGGAATTGFPTSRPDTDEGRAAALKALCGGLTRRVEEEPVPVEW